MNELKIFENSEFGKVRARLINGKPWFVLKDVCDILEIGNVSQLKTRLNGDGVITNEVIDNLGRRQEANFINESNLYKVIFQSRKENAERFTDWVTSEVLPSIRKNGAYLTPAKIEEVLSNPDTIIKLAMNLKEERQKRLLLESKVEEDKGKVTFAESVQTSQSHILIAELAKILKQNGYDIGQNRLFEKLRKLGYLGSTGKHRNVPTQKAMDMKLFKIKETTISKPDGQIIISTTPFVTGKGQVYFVNKFLKEVI